MIYFDTAKYTQNSIMVFGAIGLGYKSKLIFAEQNINEIEYRRLKRISLTQILYTGGGGGFPL